MPVQFQRPDPTPHRDYPGYSFHSFGAGNQGVGYSGSIGDVPNTQSLIEPGIAEQQQKRRDKRVILVRWPWRL